jgi:hypothetical protein
MSLALHQQARQQILHLYADYLLGNICILKPMSTGATYLILTLLQLAESYQQRYKLTIEE